MKKRIFSAIQPSGRLTLGNYLGSIKNWIKMQEDYDCIFSVADLHTITVRQNPENFRKNILETYALLLACGLDTKKCIFFIQSHVREHSELAWILECFSPVGDLSRMTQYKDKSNRYSENVNAGLLTYPSLMAGDILLYDTDLVPVGKDQKQHIEFTRNLAIRMNGIYGEIFKIPDAFIPNVGAKIMSLKDPSKKMSKSVESDATIGILDDEDIILKKIKRCVTDSGSKVRFTQGSLTGINNLMTIYSSIKNVSFDEIEKEFENDGYGKFKEQTAKAIIEKFTPIREKFSQIMKNKDYLLREFENNAKIASEIAARKVKLVREKIGFI